jgi:hypothetical protein
MTEELVIGKDLGESGRGLTGIIPTFFWRNRGKQQKKVSR